MTVHDARVIALAAVLVCLPACGGSERSGVQQTLDEQRALAERGDAGAQFNLGVMYATGEGVAQDNAEAIRWYRLAADQGDAAAQSKLGEMYMWHSFQGVPQDGGEAMHWWRLAADQGDASAQFNIGRTYDVGAGGVQQDAVEAIRWYRLAADQGLTGAQSGLAFMYAEGRSGSDAATAAAAAIRWFRLLADKGDCNGQHELGKIYRDGLGVPQDYVEAHMLFNLCAAQFLPSGRRIFVIEARDELAERMTAEQVAEAQRRAREWTPTPEP